MSENNDKEMKLLLSEKEFVIGDKTIIVKKLSILNTLRLAQQLSSIASRLVGNPDLGARALAKLTYTPKEDDSESDIAGVRLMGILELFDIAGEDIIDVIRDILVKSTNLTVAEAEELSGEKGLDIMFAIYEVNKDFFMKSLNKLKEKLPKAKKQEEKQEK